MQCVGYVKQQSSDEYEADKGFVTGRIFFKRGMTYENA